MLNVYSFYFITVVAYSYIPAISGTLGVLFSLTLVIVIYYGYWATKLDPTDPTIYAYR